jgi:hypothetical protein
MLAAILAQGISVTSAEVQQKKQGAQKQAKKQDNVQRPAGRRGGNAPLPPEVAALQPLSAVMGRPAGRGITLNLLARDALEAFVEYGTVAGQYEQRSKTISLTAGTPVEVALEGLKRDTAYVYRLNSRKPGEKGFTAGEEYRFQTQRAPGSTFTFDIQGDSYLPKDATKEHPDGEIAFHYEIPASRKTP